MQAVAELLECREIVKTLANRFYNRFYAGLLLEQLLLTRLVYRHLNRPIEQYQWILEMQDGLDHLH